MQLKNEFVVDADLDQTWRLLTAALDGRDGDGHSESLTIKVGPVTALFQGSMRFTLKDDSTRHAVIAASGKDPDGQASAAATIHAWLEQITPAQTRVLLDTDLDISGRIAQFGRGALADASNRLVAEFAADIARHVTMPPTPASAPAAVASAPAVTAPPAPPATDRYRQALLGALIGFLLSWLVFGRRTVGRRYIVLYPHPNVPEGKRITREWGRESR